MGGEWPIKSVAECAANEQYATQIGPFGKALMANEYTDSGVPVLRGVNVNQGIFHDDDFVFVSEETADRLAKYESSPGDVLLVHKGTIGQIGLMPKTRRYSRYIMGNSMLRVRCNPAKLLPEYLYYWLSSDRGLHYLRSRLSQVGVPQIQRPLTTLRETELPVPPVAEQARITNILGTIDDKIELNRQMNRTLDAMARAIFKAWFADFEPVKAKAAGATSFRGMSQAVFDQLPDRFIDTELGAVPVGWEVAPLSELIDLIGGGTPKRKMTEYWDGDVPWFSVRDAPNNGDVWVVDTEETITKAGIENSSAKIMRAGTSIISARGTVGRLALTAVPMSMNQSCYGVTGRYGMGDFLVYFTLQHAVVELQQRTHGSVFNTITRKTFDGLDRALPQPEMLAAFEEAVGPYLMKMRGNLFENELLADLRDTLLPKLISGELRVPVAEEGADAG